jgi:hypothetical protein
LNLKPETFKSKSTTLQPKCPAQCNTWDRCAPSCMGVFTDTDMLTPHIQCHTTWKFLQGRGKVCFSLVYLKASTYSPNELFLIYLTYWQVLTESDTCHFHYPSLSHAILFVCFCGRPRQAMDVLQPAGLLYRPLWTFQLWPPDAPAPTDAFRTLTAEVETYGRRIRTE